jgi:hypothetical protein
MRKSGRGRERGTAHVWETAREKRESKRARETRLLIHCHCTDFINKRGEEKGGRQRGREGGRE